MGKKIEAVTNQLKNKQFIQGFSKTARPLTYMLKIVILSKNSLTSMDVVEKDEVMDEGIASEMIEIYLSPKTKDLKQTL